jgi:hypothetical protein
MTDTRTLGERAVGVLLDMARNGHGNPYALATAIAAVVDAGQRMSLEHPCEISWDTDGEKSGYACLLCESMHKLRTLLDGDAK